MTKLLWLFLALASSAWAQGTIELARSADITAYANGVTRSPGGKPAIWVYLDYTQRQPNGAMSTRYFVEADCLQLQTRLLAVSDHSERGAGGNVIATSRPGDWSPVPPNTFRARAWEYACTGK